MEEGVKEKFVEEVDKYSSDNQVVALYSKYTREELEHNTLLIEGMEEAREKGLKEGFEEGFENGVEKGIEKGIEQGIKQGIEQGIERGILSVAKNLKSIGTRVEDISKATGLSIETIINL